MTSDRRPDPFLRDLESYSDQVFRNRPAGRGSLDPATTRAVRRLHAIDRIPPLDRTLMQQQKEKLMHLATATAMPAILPGPGSVPVPDVNGRIPRPTVDLHAPRVSRRRMMQVVTFLVLAGIFATIAYGLWEYRDNRNAFVPAVQETQTSETGAPIGTPWGQFRGGPERTGYTDDPGPGGDLTLRWSFTAEESMNAIMQAEGKVFAYGAEGGLYAIDAGTGEQVWAIDLFEGRFDPPGRVPLPAVSEGLVYVSTTSGALVAVDAATGEIAWQQAIATGLPTAPTIGEGHLVTVVDNSTLLSLDPLTGEEHWRADLASSLSIQYPTIADGKVFFPDDSTAVNAYDVNTGKLLWTTDALNAHRVAAFQEGRLYVPTGDGKLVALDASTGDMLWQTEPALGEALNPIVTESAVITAIAGVAVQALDLETGEELWTLAAAGMPDFSPHAGGNSLYFKSDAETFTVLDLTTGEAIGTFPAAGAGSTSAISGEMLFVSGRDGPVRAFGPVDGTPNEVTATAPEPVALAAGTPEDGAESEAAVPAAAAGSLQAEHQFSFPTDPASGTANLHISPESTIWRLVYDGTVEIYDRDGNLLETRTYGAGSEEGQFTWFYDSTESPSITWGAAGAAWLPDGTVHITDMGNSRIHSFDAEGNPLGAWGERGEGEGQFLAPTAITTSPGGELVVVDLGRRDVQWFDAKGNYLRSLTGPDASTPFGRPVDAMYDADGNLWVLDHSLHALFKFDQDSTLILTIGGQGTDPGKFWEPSDLDVDDQGRVWVADQSNSRFQAFDLEGNFLGALDGCQPPIDCFNRTGIILSGGNDFVYIVDYDLMGVEPERIMKFRITFIPNVPVMAAATPAAE
jgi:outer membrane protein assembly factor BamB